MKINRNTGTVWMWDTYRWIAGPDIRNKSQAVAHK